MGRPVFSLAAAFSVVLFLAVCVEWVRSCWVSDYWGWDLTGARLWVGSTSGAVRYSWIDKPFALMIDASPGYNRKAAGTPILDTTSPNWSHAGFSRTSYTLGVRVSDSAPVRYRGCGVPDWLLAILALLLPIAWSSVRLRRPPSECRVCRSCGYDLRATPKRCPECGAIPAKANESSEVSP